MKKNTWLVPLLALALIVIGPRSLTAQSVASHMHEHLDRIATIKDAIVAGQLDEVQEPATWLAEHEPVAGLAPHFEPYVELMKVYARQVVSTDQLNAAAESVSNMAKNCGNCHLVNEVNLEFAFDQQSPGNGSDVVEHMRRHQWAADRMWEGLIGPSDIAWSSGTDMLLDAPLTASDVTTSTSNVAEISRIAHRIHALGGIGTQTLTPDARSELFGEVLGLCASCHVLLNRGPAN